ncbi:hypothetical protein ROHU_008023 [Labeo rohita]|uniref:Reverse transcriptase domain-containing protein n=1 Tax=Labeo rohita TaxID=84645 RepID=A0A498M9J7_LABRO|nr:hypothetical protein ROHU_008023 [Labeo rohita]
MKKIPPESARAGEDDDSLIDYMVIDPGTKQTTRMMITKIPEMITSTPTPGCKLQICRCGWTKETTYAGLRTHQGLKKCLPSQKQGPCIDRYFLRSCSSKSSEVQQQDQNQSLQNINPPVQEEDEEPSIEVSNLSQPVIENKIQGRKPQVRWPKSCERKEWETIDTDISNLLGQLRGTVVRKLERMGDLIYNYGVERFGMVEKRKKTSPTQTKSRRQQEIERLVKERRQLKKQWRKAPEEEKEGINLLQAEIKNRLATLRRAENLRRRRKKKEQERSNFFKDPYKFAKKLFTKEKNGKLKTSKEDLETYLKQSLTDSQRCGQITLPPEMPPIHSPEYQMDISPPRWSEVKRIVQRARAASSPGPNGVPYRVYKNTPDVLRFLWRLMKVVWQKQAIPTAWRRAGGILIPKEKDSVDISQFRQISLLNVEGKIFFSVVARRLTAYLEKNHFIDTMVQKAGIPGFSGCLEHLNMIWNQIQSAKKDGRDLHVVFLDLANAFGSVPHNLLWTAFHYFSVPEVITRLVKSYFQDLQLCLTTDECTTAWQRVEIGIMAGCTISPLAFTMAMEVIIRASRWVVGGQKLKSGLRLPPIRAYMDDMTILTTTKACARRLLNKLQENIQWARMEIKPSKSRSVSVVKGKLSEQRFYVGKEPIPTVAEKPVKSLGRWYHATLKDTEQVDQLMKDTICGLESINKTKLPGRLKLWCLQFGLLPRLMWPLTIYEVPISKVEKLERVISSFAKKWLGLPRCFTNIGLYGRGILEIPISSLAEEFKCSKVRLEMTLTESCDPSVSRSAPTLVTGRKWNPAAAIYQAKSDLRHRDIIGNVQQGRGGLGLGGSRPSWQRAAPAQRRQLVVEEVRRHEQATRCVKAISQAKQGQWTRWEGVERRKISWRELMGMEAFHISFILRATYDVLPSPSNLQPMVWGRPDMSPLSIPCKPKTHSDWM